MAVTSRIVSSRFFSFTVQYCICFCSLYTLHYPIPFGLSPFVVPCTWVHCHSLLLLFCSTLHMLFTLCWCCGLTVLGLTPFSSRADSLSKFPVFMCYYICGFFVFIYLWETDWGVFTSYLKGWYAFHMLLLYLLNVCTDYLLPWLFPFPLTVPYHTQVLASCSSSILEIIVVSYPGSKAYILLYCIELCYLYSAFTMITIPLVVHIHSFSLLVCLILSLFFLDSFIYNL